MLSEIPRINTSVAGWKVHVNAVAYVLKFALLPNVIGIGLAALMQTTRPLIDLDYVLVALTFLFVKKRYASVHLGVALALDLTMTVAPAYFLPGENSAGLLLQAISHFPASFLAVGLGLLAGVTLGAGFMIKKSVSRLWYRGSAVGALVALGTIVALVDTWNGSNSFWQGNRLNLGINVANSPLLGQGKVALGSLNQERSEPVGLRPNDTATGRALLGPLRSYLANPEKLDGDVVGAIGTLSDLKLRPATDRNLVLVLVESLGSLTADPMRTNLFNLLDSPDSYRTGGVLSFRGSTVAGEARLFHWVEGAGLDLSRYAPGLPSRFSEAGYTTIALHGFFSTMFNRSKAYPVVGFNKTFFLEDYLSGHEDYPLQGVMIRGVTDRDMVAQLKSTLESAVASKTPTFAYLLTLSSHLPVDSSYAKKLGYKNSISGAHSPREIVEHEVILTDLFQALGELIRSRAIGATDWIIVGDHTPPFSTEVRAMHYVAGKVPYSVIRAVR